MRLTANGIILGALVVTAGSAQAQGGWTPQASPVPPSPPPVYVSPPPSPVPSKRLPVPPAPPPPPPPAPPSSAQGARPLGNPGVWVIDDDYPTIALRAEQQGTVGFRLTVGVDGRPTACRITASSGVPELDITTCRLLMRRARFKPALDSDGNPTEGSWASRFKWVIPFEDTGEPQYSDSSYIRTFIVEPDGTASNCRTMLNGSDVTAYDSLSPCETGETFKPYNDKTGKPIRMMVTMTSSVALTDPSAKPAAPAKPAPRRKKKR